MKISIDYSRFSVRNTRPALPGHPSSELVRTRLDISTTSRFVGQKHVFKLSLQYLAKEGCMAHLTRGLIDVINVFIFFLCEHQVHKSQLVQLMERHSSQFIQILDCLSKWWV